MKSILKIIKFMSQLRVDLLNNCNWISNRFKIQHNGNRKIVKIMKMVSKKKSKIKVNIPKSHVSKKDT